MQSISTNDVRNYALSLGWDDVGITSATISEEDISIYMDWISNKFHGDLAYMENQIRCSPQQLFPGAKTSIIFITYYKQEKVSFRSDAGVIASYARGRDYHHVHRKRLKKFIKWLEEKSGQKDIAKGFSDSTPVLEKALAVQAGLGWFGKNTLLIHRKFGTFTLISGVFTKLEFPDLVIHKREMRCGTCQKCMNACPTQAIVEPYKLNATLCLSYHLIESKKEVPEEIQRKNPGYVFGCDICQDVCPHNVRPKPTKHSDFSPEMGIGTYLKWQDFNELEKHPEKLFGTPLQRRGVSGLKDNLKRIDQK